MTDTTVDVAELVKQHAELGEQIVKLGGKVKYPDSDDADLKAKAKKSVERIKLDKAKAKAKAKDEGDEEDEEDSDDMMEDEGDDEGGKKTKKAAPKDVKKGEDETLIYKTETIKKSVVGDTQFAIFKTMAADLEKSAADIAKAQDDALTARLEKKAGEQYAHVPGTVQERGSMLKAMEKMEEPVRKAFEAVLTQSEKLAGAAFETIGKGKHEEDPTVKKAAADFNAKVNEIAKRDSIAKTAAMQKARQEFPDLFKASQEQPN